MTKQEMAMMKDLMGTIQGLTNRIGELEAMLNCKNSTSRTNVAESKDSKSKTKTAKAVVVGNLIFDGRFVRTGTGYMSSKTRFAIMKSITEEFNGVKLAKGNPTYDKCHKADKYVQVYEFKTQADCDKFRKAQEKRVG